MCFLPWQIQNLEREIQEKRRQMRILEQRIIENGEASMANASMVDKQQVVYKHFIVVTLIISCL